MVPLRQNSPNNGIDIIENKAKIETNTIAKTRIDDLGDLMLIALKTMEGIPPIIIKIRKKNVAKNVLISRSNFALFLHAVNKKTTKTSTTNCKV